MATTTLAHDSDILTYDLIREILPGIADDIAAVGLAYKRAFNKLKRNPAMTAVEAIISTSPPEYRKPKNTGKPMIYEVSDIERKKVPLRRDSTTNKKFLRKGAARHKLSIGEKITLSKFGLTCLFLCAGAFILISETSEILGGGVHGWLKAGVLEFGMIALAVAKPKSLIYKACTYSAMAAIALTTLLVLEKGIDRSHENSIARIKNENAEVVRLNERRHQIIADKATILSSIDLSASENKHTIEKDIADLEIARKALPKNYVSKKGELDRKINMLRKQLRDNTVSFTAERKEAILTAKEGLADIDGKILAATENAGSANEIRTIKKSATAEKLLRALILFLNIIFGHAAALYASEFLMKRE